MKVTKTEKLNFHPRKRYYTKDEVNDRGFPVKGRPVYQTQNIEEAQKGEILLKREHYMFDDLYLYAYSEQVDLPNFLDEVDVAGITLLEYNPPHKTFREKQDISFAHHYDGADTN